MAEEITYSVHTLRMYEQCLVSISCLYEQDTQQKFIFPVTFNNAPHQIIEILRKKYSKGAVINFISAILWKLNQPVTASIIDSLPELIDTYKKYGELLKKEIAYERMGKEFELTEREQKTFMIWEDILEIYNNMKQKHYKKDYNDFMDFVIISLYVLQPPVRADYAHMRWFIDESFVPANIEENYCVLQTTPRFVFQKYKTAHKYGVVIVPICDELHNILLEWCSVNESEYLLAHRVNSTETFKPMLESTLTKRIPRIFEKHGGKPINIATFRHSFVSYQSKNDQAFDNKQKNAAQMMHSTSMADQYRRMVYKK